MPPWIKFTCGVLSMWIWASIGALTGSIVAVFAFYLAGVLYGLWEKRSSLRTVWGNFNKSLTKERRESFQQAYDRAGLELDYKLNCLERRLEGAEYQETMKGTKNEVKHEQGFSETEMQILAYSQMIAQQNMLTSQRQSSQLGQLQNATRQQLRAQFLGQQQSLGYLLDLSQAQAPGLGYSGPGQGPLGQDMLSMLFGNDLGGYKGD